MVLLLEAFLESRFVQPLTQHAPLFTPTIPLSQHLAFELVVRCHLPSQEIDQSRLTMEGPPLIIFFLSFCIIPPVYGAYIDAILGDPVKFSATENCKKKGAKLEHLRLKDGSTLTVALWDDGWKPGPDYADRMSPNDSVILNATHINDNGQYVLTCGGQEEIKVQLNVVEASEVLAKEGESVRFPFHYNTVGEDGKYVLKKDGEIVFELHFSSGENTYGTGLEERLSVSSGWKRRGDLTLTLTRVQPEDQGDYFSHIEDKKGSRRRESFAAVRIKVTKRNLDQTTPHPPLTPTQRGTEKEWIWKPINITSVELLIIIIIVVVIIFAAFPRLWSGLKSRCSRVSSGPRGGRQYSGVVLKPLNSANPPQDANGNAPHAAVAVQV